MFLKFKAIPEFGKYAYFHFYWKSEAKLDPTLVLLYD